MDNLVIVYVGVWVKNVLSVRVFITDFKRDYDSMNEVIKRISEDRFPARTCIGVTGLPGMRWWKSIGR